MRQIQPGLLTQPKLGEKYMEEVYGVDLHLENLDSMEALEMNGWVVAGIAIVGGAAAAYGGYLLAGLLLT